MFLNRKTALFLSFVSLTLIFAVMLSGIAKATSNSAGASSSIPTPSVPSGINFTPAQKEAINSYEALHLYPDPTQDPSTWQVNIGTTSSQGSAIPQYQYQNSYANTYMKFSGGVAGREQPMQFLVNTPNQSGSAANSGAAGGSSGTTSGSSSGTASGNGAYVSGSSGSSGGGGGSSGCTPTYCP